MSCSVRSGWLPGNGHFLSQPPTCLVPPSRFRAASERTNPGVVTSDADGKPLAGVTVMVSGPALQEPQTEVTGADGRYLITQLPSGDDYLVTFYLGDTVVERPGVRIAQNKTLTISLDMPLKR